MGRAKNTLNAADVSSTPIKVRYVTSYPSSSILDYGATSSQSNIPGITVSSGSNIPYSLNLSSNELQSMVNYRLIKQLYYQVYLSCSLAGSASLYDPVWQSTAYSQSKDSTVYFFPTGSDQSILIYTIPSIQFGEQISRKSFILSASDSSYYITDDGNGNLIDTLSNNDYVGNIFYAQGIAIITNQDYAYNYKLLATEANDIYNTENNLDILIED